LPHFPDGIRNDTAGFVEWVRGMLCSWDAKKFLLRQACADESGSVTIPGEKNYEKEK